jgi:hypothetical protein
MSEALIMLAVSWTVSTVIGVAIGVAAVFCVIKDKLKLKFTKPATEVK